MKKYCSFFPRLSFHAFLSTVLFICLTSCSKEELVEAIPQKEEQIGAIDPAVSNYFLQLEDITGIDDKNSLKKVKSSILYNLKKEYKVTDDENIIIYKLKVNKDSLNISPYSVIAFSTNKGKVYAAKIVSFSSENIKNGDIAHLITNGSFTGSDYTGTISVYTVAGKLLFKNKIAQGKITSHGLVLPKKDKAPSAGRSARGTACIDWYLVTRVNGVVTSEEYQYTTCDNCDAQSSRPANTANRTSSACPGGGGGGGLDAGYTGNPPAAGQEGQTWQFTDKDGLTHRYVVQNGVWVFASILLPTATVYGNPSAYSQFVSDGPPDPGTQIMGADGFLYIYSQGVGSWVGIPPQLEYVSSPISVPQAPAPPDVLEYNCGQLRNTHGDDPIQHGSVGTIQDFVNANNGLTRSEVISQRGFQRIAPLVNLSMGPRIRYIQDPLNPDVIIDLRHMLSVAYYGPVAGNSVEFMQGMGDQPSAYDHQDYFSNNLGYDFYRIYGSSFASQPNTFVSLLQQFLTQTNSQLGTEHRTRNTNPSLINQRCP